MTKQEYINQSLLERDCLSKLFKGLNNNHDWTWYFTPEDSYEYYDALLMKFDKGGFVPIRQSFIEIKVREKHYDTLMLERIKLNNLKQLVKDYDKRNYLNQNSDIIYISTTPNGTYWFNLRDIETHKFVWLEELHWKSTLNKSLGKEMKWVTYLDTSLAKFIDIKTQEIRESNKEAVKRELITQTQYNGLFKTLFC